MGGNLHTSCHIRQLVLTGRHACCCLAADDFTQPSASLELTGGRQGRQDYPYKADPETP